MRKTISETFGLEKRLDICLTPKRMKTMELENLESSGNTYSFRLRGTGNREGHSDITITQNKGEVRVKDSVTLPLKNKGYEADIVLLKKCMYIDAGASEQNGITDLRIGQNNGARTLSFTVKGKNTELALSHYLSVSSSVMNDFFREYEMIELAFSMARSRVGK